MRAFTLTEPWATLVMIGAKSIETRGWATTYRGPLAIHAAKGMPSWAIDLIREDGAIRDALLDAVPEVVRAADIATRHADVMAGTRGRVLCRCFLGPCIPTDNFSRPHLWVRAPEMSQRIETERHFGDFSPGRYAWMLGSVMPIVDPPLIRGALGLWDWDGGTP